MGGIEFVNEKHSKKALYPRNGSSSDVQFGCTPALRLPLQQPFPTNTENSLEILVAKAQS